MSDTPNYAGVTVLSAETAADLADMEAHLFRDAERAGMSVMSLPTAKFVRVYRRVVA